MKHIGFTGTRKGMTPIQRKALYNLLDTKIRHPEIFHHGDCIGADAQAHDIAKSLGFIIHIHPPIHSYQRAYTTGDIFEKPKKYLERNHNIVDFSDCLIGAPQSTTEELRSGTWATIRYAETQNKLVYIIFPNGKTIKQ